MGPEPESLTERDEQELRLFLSNAARMRREASAAIRKSDALMARVTQRLDRIHDRYNRHGGGPA